MSAPKWSLTAAVVLLLLAGLAPPQAQAVVLSDELLITDLSGGTLFMGFLPEGAGEGLTTPPFPLSAVLIKPPGFLFLFEPGHPELGSDQITVVVSDGVFFITFTSDEPEVPLVASDPKVEELGTLQEITSGLFLEAPFKVFVLSDVEGPPPVPMPGTLALLGSATAGLAAALAWRRRRP